MNWQIIVGTFFLIGGFGNLTKDFGAFLFGLATGAALLYWGLKKKGILKHKNRPTHATNEPHTLAEETFHAVGVSYYENNIQKLACSNPDWKLTAAQVIKSGKAGRRIYKHYYVNRPVKLLEETQNPRDPNAVSVVVAGELVGYISKEDNLHVKDILKNHEIKSLSGFIGGGEYKVVDNDGDVSKDESGFSVNIRIKYI